MEVRRGNVDNRGVGYITLSALRIPAWMQSRAVNSSFGEIFSERWRSRVHDYRGRGADGGHASASAHRRQLMHMEDVSFRTTALWVCSVLKQHGALQSDLLISLCNHVHIPNSFMARKMVRPTLRILVRIGFLLRMRGMRERQTVRLIYMLSSRAMEW